MVQRVSTVAFEGIEARAVDVQVQVAPGLPAFAVVFTINPRYDSWYNSLNLYSLLSCAQKHTPISVCPPSCS
jgi:hypothetical protein